MGGSSFCLATAAAVHLAVRQCREKEYHRIDRRRPRDSRRTHIGYRISGRGARALPSRARSLPFIHAFDSSIRENRSSSDLAGLRSVPHLWMPRRLGIQ